MSASNTWGAYGPCIKRGYVGPILGRTYATTHPRASKGGGLMAKLLTPKPREPHAYDQGKLDCQRGHTANPFGHPVDRDAWERGHAEAFAEGLGDKPSFKHSGRRRRTTSN